MPKKESIPGGLQKFTLTLLKKPLSFCRARLGGFRLYMEEHMDEGTSERIRHVLRVKHTVKCTCQLLCLGHQSLQSIENGPHMRRVCVLRPAGRGIRAYDGRRFQAAGRVWDAIRVRVFVKDPIVASYDPSHH